MVGKQIRKITGSKTRTDLLVLVSRTSVMRFLARLTPSSLPPTLMCGSFLLLAPILSLEGQITHVPVSLPIREKNSAAASPNSAAKII